MVLDMKKWEGKVAVVTGASAGIGAETAKQLVEYGMLVVGLARRSERIMLMASKLHGKKGKLYGLQTDMSNPNDIIKAFKWIRQQFGRVDVLINNAGVAKQTTLIDGDIDMWQQTIDTNVLGLSVATREALKLMDENKIAGHIIHINSAAGHMIPKLPIVNVYAASKYAVTALTETLRHELNAAGNKTKVTSISPGAVATEIAQTNNFVFSAEDQKLFANVPIMETEDVIDAIVYVLSTPLHVQIHELTVWPVGQVM